MILPSRHMDADELGTVGVDVERLVINIPFQDTAGDF